MVEKLSNLAKASMSETHYNGFMAKINNRDFNDARLFVEDRVDELVFGNTINLERLKKLKTIDSIVTDKYISQIDVKDVQRVSI